MTSPTTPELPPLPEPILFPLPPDQAWATRGDWLDWGREMYEAGKSARLTEAEAEALMSAFYYANPRSYVTARKALMDALTGERK